MGAMSARSHEEGKKTEGGRWKIRLGLRPADAPHMQQRHCPADPRPMIFGSSMLAARNLYHSSAVAVTMAPRPCCPAVPFKNAIHHVRWRQQMSSAGVFRTASTPANRPPKWFRTLRDEMLSREFPLLYDLMSLPHVTKLEDTLAAHLPPGWADRPSHSSSLLPLGHHLIFFNPSVPPEKMLPDGTDSLHSPGEPFVRRMWAGGSLRLNRDALRSPRTAASAMNLKPRPWLCYERIRDVTLHGDRSPDSKIIITIERRFASYAALVNKSAGNHEHFPTQLEGRQGRVLKDLMVSSDAASDVRHPFGRSAFIEERNIVFMKERSHAELESIRNGHVRPVKYLRPLGTPDFSHSLTPDDALLFRYSALTFNAHAIHRDREYARNVEGYPNLLVHGPLSLTLMLALVRNHLPTRPGPLHTIESIEYRNLAPLFCDEPMTLCGRLKSSAEDGQSNVYDVWIAGPTGGMAVKATVRTIPHPRPSMTFSPNSPAPSGDCKDDHDWWSSVNRGDEPVNPGNPRATVTISSDAEQPPEPPLPHVISREQPRIRTHATFDPQGGDPGRLRHVYTPLKIRNHLVRRPRRYKRGNPFPALRERQTIGSAS